MNMQYRQATSKEQWHNKRQEEPNLTLTTKTHLRITFTANPRPMRGTLSTKAARSVNPRWTNLIQNDINGDAWTLPSKVWINKKSQIYCNGIHLWKIAIS
jgi:hypothetical protein